MRTPVRVGVLLAWALALAVALNFGFAGSRSTGNGLRLDCTRLARFDPSLPCPRADSPVLRLVSAVAPLRRADFPPESEWPRRARAIADMEAVDPASMSIADRIVAQNAALALALRAWGAPGGEAGPIDPHPDLMESAARLVARLALPGELLESLGSEPTRELEEWVGPRAEWVEESKAEPGSPPSGALLQHDEDSEFTIAFRPIVVLDRRCLFGQLVAIDTSFRPHITPIVGRLEVMRGHDQAARACVATLDTVRGNCGAIAGLRPRSETCIPCHGTGRGNPPSLSPEPLRPAAGRAELRRRRAALIERMSELLRDRRIREAAGG